MRWVKYGILVVLICLPVFVVFTFDDSYNSMQDSLCNQYPSFTTACQNKPDRYNRTGIISSEFYRHINYYLGRNSAQTPAFIESVRSQTDSSGKADPRIPRVEKKLSVFNRNFIAALNISLALAGAALTIAVQKTYRTARSTRRNKIANTRSATVIAPTVSRPAPAKRTRTSKQASTTKKLISSRSKTAPTRPKKPPVVRLRQAPKKQIK